MDDSDSKLNSSLQPVSLSSPMDPKTAAMLHCVVKGSKEYALLLLDPQERIIYCNEGALKILGYEESDLVGRPIHQIFTAEDLELGVANREIDKAREDGYAEDERWHVRKDGTRLWGSGVVTCVRDDAQEVVGFTKVFRDLSLRKITEDSLRSSVAELTHFSFAVAHDLQEPLREVAGYLSLLSKKFGGKIASEHDKYLATASEATKRLQSLISDLLSSVHAKNRKLRLSDTDCSAVFDTALSRLGLLIEESHAVVTRTGLPILQADSTQLVHVFQNLVANAVKYRKAGAVPKVFADVEFTEKEWFFSVRDNGIGIPESERQHVFEAFKRLHSRDQYVGTGLGLFLCKRIIEQHGGRIWIEPQFPHGTAVRFTLPRIASDEHK